MEISLSQMDIVKSLFVYKVLVDQDLLPEDGITGGGMDGIGGIEIDGVAVDSLVNLKEKRYLLIMAIC